MLFIDGMVDSNLISDLILKPLMLQKSTLIPEITTVSEDIKNALLKNKISNIFLTESFGCTKKEYKMLKKTKLIPQIRNYSDK